MFHEALQTKLERLYVDLIQVDTTDGFLSLSLPRYFLWVLTASWGDEPWLHNNINQKQSRCFERLRILEVDSAKLSFAGFKVFFWVRRLHEPLEISCERRLYV
eukprot:snap_masked-scaffold_5-processed-gene-18.34-mRNA-1 protein AED:1.00 eAED:1.00 QI:0/0/0/0/1/1/2/0/102